MTQPNPEDAAQAGGQGGSRSAAKTPTANRLDVVEYTHHDALTGQDVTHVGVVVRPADKDHATVAVRPLAHHHIEVDPAKCLPISAEDVS
jgi:hypothetical protein